MDQMRLTANQPLLKMAGFHPPRPGWFCPPGDNDQPITFVMFDLDRHWLAPSLCTSRYESQILIRGPIRLGFFPGAFRLGF